MALSVLLCVVGQYVRVTVAVVHFSLELLVLSLLVAANAPTFKEIYVSISACWRTAVVFKFGCLYCSVDAPLTRSWCMRSTVY
jgi:hypothetical protein